MTRVRTLLVAAFVGGLAAAPAQAQQFGYEVAIDGRTVLIAEPVDPNGTGAQGTPRSLYAYTRSGGEWVQSGTIRAPAHEGADFFGRSVVLEGDRLYVGATARDYDGDGQSDGAIYVYRRDGGGWAYDSEIRPESVPVKSRSAFLSSLGFTHA